MKNYAFKKSDEQLNGILHDKKSGSAEIVIKLNKYILSNHANSEALKLVLSRVKQQLSHFAEVNNYINQVENLFLYNDAPKLLEFLKNYDASLKNKYYHLYKNAKPFLRNVKKILTLSNSKTLLEIFKIWNNDTNGLTVVIAESRPMYEGRNFAKALLKQNIKVEFITDAMVSLAVKEADAAVIGADAVLENSNIINKTGSVSLALLCRHYKKKFFVICTRSKFVNKTLFKVSDGNPSEVWKFKDKNLHVRNIYFEEINKNLITKIITD